MVNTKAIGPHERLVLFEERMEVEGPELEIEDAAPSRWKQKVVGDVSAGFLTLGMTPLLGQYPALHVDLVRFNSQVFAHSTQPRHFAIFDIWLQLRRFAVPVWFFVAAMDAERIDGYDEIEASYPTQHFSFRALRR